MIGVRSALALLAVFAVTPVLACQKIEYAEAKDWSPEELQRQYCASLAEQHRSTEAAKAAPTPQTGLAVLRMSQNCLDQASMYERIFKNVHKMDVPTCKQS